MAFWLLLDIALLFLMLAWPVVVAGALVLVVLAVRRLRGDQFVRDRPSGLVGAGRLVAIAAALTAMAAYGYGLSTTTFMAITDPDDRCGLTRPDLYGYGYRGPDDGSLDVWPLQDTTCGPDLVPGFVNPVVMASTALAGVLSMILVFVGGGSARRSRATRPGT